ncbi:unnamed protein product [Cuscuta campestris]|uniref:FANCI helical domain-containing protein n=1 Tax=Cuscuta campestris TaxID=132261 RepID=A0A484LL85_9ASTE|nr:unnamed protein product [Cuscuta campestris]
MSLSAGKEARVREIVYHGLLKLVLIDPLVAEHVLNFILPHFQRFLTRMRSCLILSIVLKLRMAKSLLKSYLTALCPAPVGCCSYFINLPVILQIHWICLASLLPKRMRQEEPWLAGAYPMACE